MRVRLHGRCRRLPSRRLERLPHRALERLMHACAPAGTADVRRQTRHRVQARCDFGLRVNGCFSRCSGLSEDERLSFSPRNYADEPQPETARCCRERAGGALQGLRGCRAAWRRARALRCPRKGGAVCEQLGGYDKRRICVFICMGPTSRSADDRT